MQQYQDDDRLNPSSIYRGIVNGRYQSFLNELRVLKKEIWNLGLINEVLGQVLLLFRVNEKNRAQGLWERWFCGLSFGELINLIPKDEVMEKHPVNAAKECLSPGFAETLKTIGRIGTYLQGELLGFDSKLELHKEAQANIATGLLEESDYITDNKNWCRALAKWPPYFYPREHEASLLRLLRTRNWLRIFIFLDRIKSDSLSGLFKNIGFLWTLFSRNEKLIEKWKPADNAELVSHISDEQNTTDYYHDQYLAYTTTCFILGWQDRAKDVTEVVDLVAGAVLSQRRNDRVITASRLLFRYSTILGQWFKEVFDERKKGNFVFIQPNQLSEIIQKLFSFQEDHLNAHIQTNDVYSS